MGWKALIVSAVLDTNIVLHVLRDELDEDLPTTGLGISVVTEIELLGYPSLTTNEEAGLRRLLKTLRVVPLNDAVKEEAIRARRDLRLKLPDAVILATAVVTGSKLLTNDRDLAARAPVPCRSLRLRGVSS